MKGYAEFIEQQNEIAIRRKLKLSKAKSERKGRNSKVGYQQGKKVVSAEYQGLTQKNGQTYAKISEPGTGTTSTVPISDIRTVND
tara:strand:+ start:327 stop:581 length:255 start_codon:yes stop_codon:yes gene_type:complete